MKIQTGLINRHQGDTYIVMALRFQTQNPPRRIKNIQKGAINDRAIYLTTNYPFVVTANVSKLYPISDIFLSGPIHTFFR